MCGKGGRWRGNGEVCVYVTMCVCVCVCVAGMCILNVVFVKEVNPLTIIATNVSVTVHTMPVVLLLHV